MLTFLLIILILTLRDLRKEEKAKRELDRLEYEAFRQQQIDMRRFREDQDKKKIEQMHRVRWHWEK